MKKLMKIIGFIVLGFVVICFALGLFGYIYGQTPGYKTSATENARLTSLAPTQPVFIQLTPTHQDGTVSTSIPSIQPTFVPIKEDACSFLYKYLTMTDPQRHQFEIDHKGQKVDWTYGIDNVKVFLGMTYIDIEIPCGNSYTSIWLFDAPKTITDNLNRGQTIHFTGNIDSISWTGGPLVQIKETQILK